MWCGGHCHDEFFEITFGRSLDGLHWSLSSEKSVFPAVPDRNAFDGRYTSTPQVLSLPGKYVLYYSARDWDDTWIAPDGSRQAGPDG